MVISSFDAIITVSIVTVVVVVIIFVLDFVVVVVTSATGVDLGGGCRPPLSASGSTRMVLLVYQKVAGND